MKTLFFILILSIFVVVLGYNYYAQPILRRKLGEIAMLQQQAAKVASESAAVIDNKDLTQLTYEKLSNKEKISQLLLVSVNKQATDPANLSEIVRGRFGGLVVANDVATGGVAASRAQYQEFNRVLFMAYQGFALKPLLVAEGLSKGLQPWQKTIEENCAIAADKRAALLDENAIKVADYGFKLVLGPNVTSNSVGGSAVVASSTDPMAPSADVAALSTSSSSAQLNNGCVDNWQAAAEDLIKSYGKVGIISALGYFPVISTNKTQLVDEKLLEKFDYLFSTFPNSAVVLSRSPIKDQFDGEACAFASSCVSGLREGFPELTIISSPIGFDASAEDKIYKAILAGNDYVWLDKTVSLVRVNELVDGLVSQYDQSADFRDRVNAALDRLAKIKRAVAE